MAELRDGVPEVGELVIAMVTNIQYHSVFCSLNEFKDASGMLHISEVAPGRIKNLSDYVREGKTLVLKVLKVDEEKGHIDLSLRRVSDSQRKAKASERKHQQIVEHIASQASEILKKESKVIQEELAAIAIEYGSIMDLFQAVAEDTLDLSTLKMSKKEAQTLTDLIKERISPRSVTIKGSAEILTYVSNGVELVQAAFKDLPSEANCFYTGGGNYSIEVTAPNYKHAEDVLKQVLTQVRATLGEDAVKFERTDGR